MGMFDDNGAMSPFFDETVKFRTVRNGTASRFTVKACVFPMAEDNPFDDTGAGKAARRKMSVTVAFEDWCFRDAPQVGDGVTLEYGAKFAVEKCTRGVAGWDMEVREC